MSQTYEERKWTNLQVAEDLNFEPVTDERLDDSEFGIDGKFIVGVRCKQCGRQYKVSSGLWQLKHYLAHEAEKNA